MNTIHKLIALLFVIMMSFALVSCESDTVSLEDVPQAEDAAAVEPTYTLSPPVTFTATVTATETAVPTVTQTSTPEATSTPALPEGYFYSPVDIQVFPAFSAEGYGYKFDEEEFYAFLAQLETMAYGKSLFQADPGDFLSGEYEDAPYMVLSNLPRDEYFDPKFLACLISDYPTSKAECPYELYDGMVSGNLEWYPGEGYIPSESRAWVKKYQETHEMGLNHYILNVEGVPSKDDIFLGYYMFQMNDTTYQTPRFLVVDNSDWDVLDEASMNSFIDALVYWQMYHSLFVLIPDNGDGILMGCYKDVPEYGSEFMILEYKIFQLLD